MRVKRRQKQRRIFFIIAIVIMALFVTFGYSLLSSRLNINGSVHTMPLVSGNDLQVTLTETGGRYSTGTLPNSIRFQSETLNENLLTITVTKGNNNNKPYTVSLTINFQNIYTTPLTNGIASTAVQSGTTFSNHSATLSNQTINAGANGTMTVNYTFINRNAAVPSTLRTTMQYNAGSVIQYFYFDIVVN